jgi:hypothetical protein
MSSRRAFVLSGGATLGAGVAATASALPTAPRPLAATEAEDREAIRQLHAEFIAGVEGASIEGAATTHRAYRSNARQNADQLTLAADRATASWNVDVQVVTPIEGDSTVAQMARLQGQYGDVRWETGRLEAAYEKTNGQWCVTSMRYVAA